MSTVIDLAKFRRMRFESYRTEEQLAKLNFDEYGNPYPYPLNFKNELDLDDYINAIEKTTLRDRISPEAIELIIKNKPELARKLRLFPKLKILREIDFNF
jgi:hypothetical protein